MMHGKKKGGGMNAGSKKSLTAEAAKKLGRRPMPSTAKKLGRKPMPLGAAKKPNRTPMPRRSK
jgi:hypothetical protein